MGAAKTTSLKQIGGAAKLGAAMVPGERISETRLANATNAVANLNNTQSRGGGNGSVIDSGDEDEGYEDRGNGTAGNRGSGGEGDGSDNGDEGDQNSASGYGEDGLQSDDEGKESEVPILIVHEQPVPRQDTGEDGYLPVKGTFKYSKNCFHSFSVVLVNDVMDRWPWSGSAEVWLYLSN